MPMQSSSKSTTMSSFMCCTSERSGRVVSGGRTMTTYRSEQSSNHSNQSKFLWLDPTRWNKKKEVRGWCWSKSMTYFKNTSIKKGWKHWQEGLYCMAHFFLKITSHKCISLQLPFFDSLCKLLRLLVVHGSGHYESFFKRFFLQSWTTGNRLKLNYPTKWIFPIRFFFCVIKILESDSERILSFSFAAASRFLVGSQQPLSI